MSLAIVVSIVTSVNSSLSMTASSGRHPRFLEVKTNCRIQSDHTLKKVLIKSILGFFRSAESGTGSDSVALDQALKCSTCERAIPGVLNH